MKSVFTIFMLSILCNLLISCESNPNASKTNYMASTAANVQKTNVMKEAFVWANVEVMEPVLVEKVSEENADEMAVMSIRQAFFNAENEAQLLDVNFSMSDEPVETGVLMFAIESESAKELTIEMYDEEGFGMVANNQFGVNEGNNYKALNVKNMENGAYLFRLRDAEGKELVRNIEVANQ